MALVEIILQWMDLFYTFKIYIFISALFFLLIKLNKSWSDKPNQPPSPPKLPVIGNLHQLSTLVHRSLRDLSDKYGPLMLLQFGGTPTLVVSSAEMAKEILKTHDITFANRPSTTATKVLLYECTGVGFSPYSEYWRQIKKFCVAELLSIKRVQSFNSVRQEEVANMMDELHHSSAMGTQVNLSDMLMVLTNNIISWCVLGRKHKGDDGKNKFAELTRELLSLFIAFSFGDLFPWLAWVDNLTGLVGRMKKVSRELDSFFDQIIEEHISKIRHDDPEDQKDFIDVLLHAQKHNTLNVNFSRDNIKAIILDMFVGGSDTTSTILEWVIAELIKNPIVMKKAQEEVRRVVGKKSKIEEDDIKQMDYLQIVVKETLRLHPVAVFIPRQSSRSTNISNYIIPANTRVFINVFTVQRDPKVWDRAEEFIPERFINNTIDFKGRDFEFIPFGSGRRGCPGMLFGIRTVEFVVANLIHRYDWKLPSGAEEELDMSEAFGLTINKKFPLHLISVFNS